MLARLFLLFFSTGFLLAAAADWPTWRGPAENGSSPEKTLPETWADGKNVAWTADLPGPGAGTPLVLGERVFLPSVDGEEVTAICLDATTGKQLWKQTVGPNKGFPRKGNSAQPSPASDGERVVFLTGTGWLAAFDLDGKELWKEEVTKSLGPFKQNFGYGATPVFIDGKLVMANLVRVPHGKSFVVAYDPATGQELWKVERPTDAEKESGATYASVVPIEFDGKPAALVAGGDVITIHDLADGNELLRQDYAGKKKQKHWRLVATPTVDGDIVYFQDPRGGRVTRYELADGKLNETWSHKGKYGDVPCPLLYEGLLFILNGRDRVLYCFDPKEGTKLWEEKLPLSGPLRASPVGAGGMVYCVSEDGVATVFAAAREPKQVASFQTKRPGTLATPAVAGGALYLRDDERLTKVAP
ncbi:MAG: PQQ-binding-like beta-propeller repeat protein [Verrucomicrobiota bacterium]